MDFETAWVVTASSRAASEKLPCSTAAAKYLT